MLGVGCWVLGVGCWVLGLGLGLGLGLRLGLGLAERGTLAGASAGVLPAELAPESAAAPCQLDASNDVDGWSSSDDGDGGGDGA